MGIPKFYRWISERYPCLSEVINETQVPEFDCLYLDMNGIIHVCSHPSDDVHFRMSEKEMFVDICRYIEVLFRIIAPKRTFLMAVDGVAPRAKMNQQRARRFKTARDAEKKEEEARQKGEKLPDEPPFDSNCITPGTDFMDRLHQQLKYFTAQKVSTDKKWQSCEIILSGHDVPGEGEHKIMDYIRAQRAKPDYDPNTRHCMYGLDADLIMLGLCSHEPHFSLLREEIRFGKFAQQGKQNSRVSNADRTTFHLLHLSLLREYLEMEFKALKETLPFDFDVERIIDDWVLMGFLVGNDFIPHLPFLHINKNALSILHNTYIKVLPSLGGYLNEDGQLNLRRFEAYCRALGEADRNYFEELNEDMQWLKSKQLGDAIIEHHETHLSPTSNCKAQGNGAAAIDDSWLQKLEAGFLFDEDEEGECLEGGASDSEKVVAPSKSDVTELRSLFSHEFEEEADDDASQLSQDNLEYLHWKRVYYIEKFNIQNPSLEFIREQVELYIRALQWNLHYYYHGCQSWSWFYCQHYAPFVSDLRSFTDVDMAFDYSEPFKPFQQLLAVLPSRSRHLIPDAYVSLMTEGPIVDFYPKDFELDLNGKQMDWEAVVLIPFIDEKRLLDAMSLLSSKLNQDERHRNSRGVILAFHFDAKLDYEYPAVFHYNAMDHCKAEISEFDHTQWVIPKEDLRFSLLPGVRLDVYFDGFPTTKHLEYTSDLRSEGIRVFQSHSRGQSMVITVLPRPNIQNLDDVQKLFFGGSELSVYVKWPYLKEAKVIAISDSHTRCKLDEEGNLVTKALEGHAKMKLLSDLNAVIDSYHNKRGVVIGHRIRDSDKEDHKCSLMVEVVELVGRRNVYHPQTSTVTLEPKYAPTPEVYPFDLCVYGISTQSRQVKQATSLAEMFPRDSTVFLIGSSYYGEEAQVLDCMPDGSVKFQFFQKVEPNFDDIIKNKEILAMQYFSQIDVARRLQVSPLLVGRLTGSIFVLPPPEQKESQENILTQPLEPSGSKGGGNDRGLPPGWCQNIGLNLKFNKSNEEVMGYTKRMPNDDHFGGGGGGGGWMYSEKCIEVMEEYMSRFPVMFENLKTCIGSDKFKAEDLFGPEDAQYQLDQVTQYLKTIPCAKAKKISCNSQILEEQVLVQIQSEIERCNIANHNAKRAITAKGSPANLFRPSDLNGSLMPDETTQFRMFDRVVNVRDGFCVPVGLRGTVIGLPSKKPSMSRDAIIDVLFDQPFLGAHQAMPGTWLSAYRLPATSLINVSHGFRVAKKNSDKTDARFLPKTTPQSHASPGEHSDSKSGKTGMGIRQLLDQASAAAVNEKMYQMSKLTRNGSNSAFAPVPSGYSNMHEPASAFDQFTQQMADVLPNVPAAAPPQGMSVDLEQFKQLVEAQSSQSESLGMYDSFSNGVPSNSFYYQNRRGGRPFGRQGYSNQGNWRTPPFNKQWSNGQEYSNVDVTNIESASKCCAPFADLNEQHQLQFPHRKPVVHLEKLQTGFACSLDMLERTYDGPICDTELDALTEASLGLIKLLNSQVLSQNYDAYQAHPGLYKPQQFYTPHQNGMPLLLNQSEAAVVSQVLVPGQVDVSNLFTPANFNPNSFEAFAAMANQNRVSQQQQMYHQQDPSVNYMQNMPQGNARQHQKPRRGRGGSARSRQSRQNCAMSFNS